MRISYQKRYGNNGTVFRQMVKITRRELNLINFAIALEIENNYKNYKDYSWDYNSATLYLELLTEEVNYTNLTTNRFIAKLLNNKRLKTDRNTIYQVI